MDRKEEIKLQEEQIKEDDYKLTKEDESETNQQQEAVEKEKFDSLEVVEVEEKVIQVCQDKELPGVVEEKSHKNAAETGGENQLQATRRAHASARVLEGSQTGSSRKPSQGSKPSPRLKTTVPQPFCFATEKRMTRDRRSVDLSSLPDQQGLPKETRGPVKLKDSQPKLTKSVSLINIKTRSLPGPGFGQASTLKHTNSSNAAATTKTSSKMKVSTTERGEKKIENTNLKNTSKIVVNNEEVESRHLQVGTAKKQQGKEKGKAQLQKSSTYKAPPLPSFYHRKDSLYTPQANKNPLTGPKSPALGQKSQSIPNGDKIEEKGKATVSSRRITSSGAKETAAKLFKSIKGTLNMGSKETVKGVVASV